MDRPPEHLRARAGTRTVTLRRWHPSDRESLCAAVQESSAHLGPWMSWTEDFDLPAADAYLDRAIGAWDRARVFEYAVDGRGPDSGAHWADAPTRILGAAHLFMRAPDTDTRPGTEPRSAGAEIGCWLHPAVTRRGLATGVSAALVSEAFRLPGVRWLEIRHDSANTASVGLSRRLGFTEVARRAAGERPERQRRPLLPGEEGTDVLWRLTADDYAAAATGAAG